MRQDMTNILLNSVSDEDLHWELVRQARSREIRAILELWSLESSEVPGVHGAMIHPDSVTEMSAGSVNWWMHWVAILLFTAFRREAKKIICHLSERHYSSSLPLRCPSLHRIQNHLQAVTIAATLRTLVPHLSRNTQSPDSIIRSDSSFTERVLSLS